MSTAERIIVQQQATVAQAHDVFDSAAPVEPDFMIGTWKGAELRTGHRMDGMLGASGWWGKAFVDAETVHPLLFPTADGRALWALDPRRLPFGLLMRAPLPSLEGRSLAGLVAASRPVMGTRKPKARLRTTEYGGVGSATMVYDAHPINDVFRKIDDDTVIGLMDLRGAQPYFFSLRRDGSLPVLAQGR
ncbi:DUF4334 domain-containing protein [Williamsia soli]|uniref:DUF4334 domain-containing protein n=1 Tax=Williamsia soli TaxID=364929 RepID=UPI001A9F21F0|nr:DUF4334 domain-containing protein [Williamsia soli]